jgi:hypothetical protein
MDRNPSYRPRVSRETRLLLTAALGAVAALWLLARIRFPDLPATPNPVPPLLSQLTPAATFEGLASEVSQLQARLEPMLTIIDASSPALSGDGTVTRRLRALRLRDDLAIAVVPDGAALTPGSGARLVGTDAPSGLVVIRVPAGSPVSSPTPWVPTRLERPKYLMVADGSTERIILRPVFVAALEPVANALWPDPIWAIEPPNELAVGSFVFTTAGELLGVVIEYAARRAIVPASLVLVEVDRLLKQPVAPAGDVGIRVQSLTLDLSSATGASGGVVVTWVDPTGPAAGVVATGEVIEATDGQAVLTPAHWRVRLARLSAGDVLTLRVRGRGGTRDVALAVPAPAPAVVRTTALGLRTRRAPGRGTEVLSVEPGSAAARGGLVAGDVITVIGDVSSPTPAQVRAAFTSARKETHLLVGVTRGAMHLVTTLTR